MMPVWGIPSILSDGCVLETAVLALLPLLICCVASLAA